MKKKIAKKSFEEMIRNYPISDLLEEWFFKYYEASNGHSIAEGSDQYGRIVSCEDSEDENLLCI